MKKNSVAKELLKLFGVILLGWLLWICIFAIFGGEGDDLEPFKGAAATFGVLTGVIILFIIDYNAVSRLNQKVKAMHSNIKILVKRGDALLEKANKVSDKYMKHEKDTYVQIADKRKAPKVPYTKRIVSASQFQAALENYPELKANQNIMELLSQIKESENAIASSKIEYNNTVEDFNTMIHSFPFNLIRRIAKFKDAEFYEETDDLISDEALGI